MEKKTGGDMYGYISIPGLSFDLKVRRRIGGMDSGEPNVLAGLPCAAVRPQPGSCRFIWIVSEKCFYSVKNRLHIPLEWSKLY